MSLANQVPADVGIIEPPPDRRTIIEKTALLVSQHGFLIERRINEGDVRFKFLEKTDPYHAFYQHKITEYSARNQDGAQL